jgi:predicted ATPase
MESYPLRFVISGGPGSGKSSLIDALRAAGEMCAPEVSRQLIREQVARGGDLLPWNDLDGFADECIRRMQRQVEQLPLDRPVFLDRGLPDVVGYLRRAGRPVPGRLLASASLYAPVVFFAPPWARIYVNDAERPQSFDEAQTLGTHIRAAYEELKFHVMELPLGTIAARVEHVRRVLRDWTPGKVS